MVGALLLLLGGNVKPKTIKKEYIDAKKELEALNYVKYVSDHDGFDSKAGLYVFTGNKITFRNLERITKIAEKYHYIRKNIFDVDCDFENELGIYFSDGGK